MFKQSHKWWLCKRGVIVKYCQGPLCHTYDTKTGNEDRKIIREMKQEEDHSFII